MDNKWFKKSEQTYWLWLSLKLNNQNTVFQRLLDAFGGSPRNIYDADEDELRGASVLNEMQINALLNKDLSEAISIYDYCKWNRDY